MHSWQKNLVDINSRPRLPILGVFLSVCLIAQGTGSDRHNALDISPSGHYIEYKGEVLMLIGDSGTQCASQNSNPDHRQWIDDCACRGIRAIHLWSFVPVRQKQDGSQIEERWDYYPFMTPNPLSGQELPAEQAAYKAYKA